jgi:hypothetical protein
MVLLVDWVDYSATTFAKVLSLYAGYHNETHTHLGWARMRRYDVPSNDLGPSSPHHLVRIASSLRADMILGKDTSLCNAQRPRPRVIVTAPRRQRRGGRDFFD